MSDPHTWQETVEWTIVYTAVAWAIIFLARLIFLAPLQLYLEKHSTTLPSGKAQNDMASALREHTMELTRQREARRDDMPPMIKNMFDARNRRERIAMGLERDPDAPVLQLSVGTDHEYYDVPQSGLYSLTRRFKVKIENISSNQTITNGKLQIISIEPPCGYRGPWLIKEGITLAAGDHIFLPLAQYNELREPEKGMTPEDTFKIESVETREHRAPLLGTENQPHVLALRATAPGVPFCDMKCKLWVDEHGRFRIEKN